MDIVTVIMLETMMRSLIRIVMTKTTTEIMLMTTTMMVMRMMMMLMMMMLMMMMLMVTIVKLHMSWGCVPGGAPGWESVGGLSAGFWRSDTRRTIPGYSSPTLRLSNRLLFLETESSSDSDPRQIEAAHIRHSDTRAVWVFLGCSKVPELLFKVTVKLE